MEFDHFFPEGEKFRYGALNIGSMGATAFGDHSIVLKRESFPQKEEVVFIKNDSLNSYFQGNVFQSISFGKEIGNFTSVHFLAGIKHFDHNINRNEKDNASLICSEKEYIEVIFVKKTTLQDIQEIRMSESTYEKLSFSALNAEKKNLSYNENVNVSLFNTFLENLDKHEIPLKVI